MPTPPDDPMTRPFGLLLPPRPEPRREERPITLTATAIAADGSYTYESVVVWLTSSHHHQVRRGRHVA